MSRQEVLSLSSQGSSLPLAAPPLDILLPCVLWTEGRDFIPHLETGTDWRPRGDE